MKPATILIFLAVALFAAVGCTPQDNAPTAMDSAQVKDGAQSKEQPVPEPQAYLRPGAVGDGSYVLPNGRLVRPAGDVYLTPTFPNDVAVSPDGNTVVIATGMSPTVCIFDVALGEITQQFTEEIHATFNGIVFNDAGDRFWVSGGGDHSIYEFDLIEGVAVFLRRIPVAGFPTGLKLSNDEQFIYTALHKNKRMVKIRLQNGKEVKSFSAHLFPYDLAVSPDESTGYVSNFGVDSISVFDLDTTEVIEEIAVGSHPEGLALSPSGNRLYVANSDADSISVIDTATLAVIDVWDLHDEQILTMGARPLAIEVSADGSRLYVACAGYNSLDVIDTADGTVLGRIPSGWYPTNSALDPSGQRIYVAVGKGLGSNEIIHGAKWPGVLQVVDLPSPVELQDYTDQADQAVRWSHYFFEDWYSGDLESPIPTEFGVRSQQIRHVVFILKENKTYDQILGGLEGAEGSTRHLIFPEYVTPNHHRLAREFVNCDNFYVEGDISVMGHMWATFLNLNDHMEKAFFAGGNYPVPDVDPASRTPEGTIFEKILDNGLEFRSYGQFIGMAGDLERMAPYMDLHYGFWNMETSDENEKADEIIREWEKGMFPDLIYILLPNDHNYGGRKGAPTPRWLMADNDAGLGKLVQWISHSKYWDETVIFVSEDDPQSGSDHIDPHRTIGFVISPWTKRGHVSSVLYSQSSMWLTIELILGLPPHTKFDQFAAPMFDAFTMEKNSIPYAYTPNPIPFELNQDDKHMDKFCGTPNFLVPDGAPGLGRVLWAMYRPGEPFPDNLSVDRCFESDEEEQEEQQEIIAYVETANRLIAWGKKRGIEVPVPTGWWELTAKIEQEKLREAVQAKDDD